MSRETEFIVSSYEDIPIKLVYSFEGVTRKFVLDKFVLDDYNDSFSVGLTYGEGGEKHCGSFSLNKSVVVKGSSIEDARFVRMFVDKLVTDFIGIIEDRELVGIEEDCKVTKIFRKENNG